MSRRDRHVIVLAAGKGTRMRSRRPKVLHPLAGQSLIDRVLRTSRALDPKTITVVLGHHSDLVQAALGRHRDLQFVRQEPQLGTAHALQQARSAFASIQGNLVVLSGDVPRLRSATLTTLIDTPRGSRRRRDRADRRARATLRIRSNRPVKERDGWHRGRDRGHA